MASASSNVPPTSADVSGSKSSPLSSVFKTVRTAVAVPENELKRWRRTFETNAKVINGEKSVSAIYSHVPEGVILTSHLSISRFLDPESFVNAIAPKGDLTKIDRAQFSVLFRVADTSRRGLVSWEDYTVFETLLKRPDADYWIAFQFFDV